MIGAALLLATASFAAPAPPAATMLEARLSVSAAARRLLLAAGDVPRREGHDSGLPLAIDERGGDRPEIVIDLQRIRGLPPGEAEAEYARALSRAAIAAPIPLIEAEEACRHWAAEVLVEMAAEDSAFSPLLRSAERAPIAGAPELTRSAQFLHRFEENPDEAWWSVTGGAGVPREAARLTEIEDLFALHAAELRALKVPPDAPYADLGGRRYPGNLVRAAYRLREPGAPERIREALGAFDSVGVASLRAAIALWRRGLAKP